MRNAESDAPGPDSAFGLPRSAFTWVPLLTGLLAFAVYALTGAPCAWWGDGLELTTAAWCLGVAHPTGYPLYTALGWGWTHGLVHWLDPGHAMTLFSAGCLAIGVGVLTRLFASVAREPLAGAPSPPPSAAAALATGALAALALAFSRTVWEHGTFAEVYPLTWLLGGLTLALCWRARGRSVGPATAGALGILMGLLAINHYSGGALAILALAMMFDWTRRAPRRRWLVPVCAVAGFAAMVLAGWGYLVVAASHRPPMNWGDPSSLGRLFWVLRGGQYAQMKLELNAGWLGRGLWRWLDWWGAQWLPGLAGASPAGAGRGPQALLGILLVLLAVAGLADLARRRIALAIGLIGVLALSAASGAVYHIVDIDAYFIVALPAAMTGWLVVARRLAAALARLPLRLTAPPMLRTLVALALVTLVLANWRWISKSGDTAPLDWGRKALEPVPPGAMVITQGDNDIYALWYQQIVLGRGKGVRIFGSNFMFSGWYASYFPSDGRPIWIKERPPASSRFDFELTLAMREILPFQRETHAPVFTTFMDPLLAEFFQPQPMPALLPDAYYEWFNRRYTPTLPEPRLYMLRMNPDLMKLDDAKLEQRFRGWYRQLEMTFTLQR